MLPRPVRCRGQWLRWALAIAMAGPAGVRASPGEAIHLAHYNMLASYLGDNREPWFLQPLNLSVPEREALQSAYYEKTPEGKYLHSFADGFGGLITAEQRQQVEQHQEHFLWANRWPKILRQVKDWAADIVSIVEMDRFHEFQAALSDTYESAFAKRPRRKSKDGSSLFWRRSRFELVGCPLNITFQDWEPCHERIHHEDRVMLMVALRDKMDVSVFVVASVHLMRNPEDKGKDPLRMLEVSQMMRALSCFMGQVGASGLILMGDFNAVPESFTHLFLLHGWQDCQHAEKEMKDVFDDCCWNRTGVCTTRTSARSVWIDYIFYSGRTVEMVEPPRLESCPEHPIPDAAHPSDHLPIRASLRFMDGAWLRFPGEQTALGQLPLSKLGQAAEAATPDVGSCLAGLTARSPAPSAQEGVCLAHGREYNCTGCEQG